MEPLNTDVGGTDAVADQTTTDSVDNGGSATQQQPTGENPAWAELLGVLPTSLHQTVKPYLEKWETGVNNRFATVQSQYEPYKGFLGTDPEQINASLQLAQMIASDPRAFYDRMTEHYGAEWGLDTGQGQGADNADEYSLDGIEEDNPYANLEGNPLIKQLQDQQNTIASFLASQVEQEQQAKEQQAVAEASKSIETELAAIASNNGMESLPKEAERMILEIAMARNADSLEGIAAEVMPMFKAAQTQQSTAPRIISPGGGVPSANIDTAKMNSNETKSLVASILASRNSGN